MKTDTLFTLSDGRKLGYAEYGSPKGKPVFFFNGSGGSRLERPADESVLTELSIRFISTDRSGHGFSDYQPHRTLLDWPNDIRELADHLNIKRFHVLGYSAGGPYALACSHALPGRVIVGGVISGLAPSNRSSPYKGLPFSHKIVLFILRNLPPIVYLTRWEMYKTVSRSPEALVKKLGLIGKKLGSLPPPDRRVLEMPEVRKIIFEDVCEGYRQGWRGVAQDDLVIHRQSWGFRLEDVKTTIKIWHGDADTNVPLSQGTYQHDALPNSSLTVLPGEGHLYLLGNWKKILEKLIE